MDDMVIMPGAEPSISFLECGVASRALPGEEVCGDSYFMKTFGNCALVAVVDGVGHGEEAARASAAASAVLETYGAEPLISLIRRCHEDIRNTRGAVISIASIDAQFATLTWLGVGNAESILLRADPRAKRESLLLFGGLVGFRLPNLRAVTLPLSAGDTLVMATDGIRREFLDDLPGRENPQRLAERILERYCRDNDDSLVVTARFKGLEG